MTDFNGLYETNHKISERIKIFLYLIKKRSVCDTQVANELFYELLNMIKKQTEREDKDFFKDMLTSSIPEVKTFANNFLSGSSEIKRVIKQYTKRWTFNNHLRIKDHESFINDSNEAFGMIDKHIVLKTEKLYPEVRKMRGE
ncbi:MAG: hypothetical protein GY694_00660 [Gammaproteobacteria bacterium]|nr:hypothetical protein [Gammaproteobacteria bacterium]